MFGAHVLIDRSQFPESVRGDLLESLRTRAINHKFHYESYKQAAKWLALHEGFSPARTDASCARIYDAAFTAAALEIASPAIHMAGLGCGGGQKEARLLKLLRAKANEVVCTLLDVSLPLVLTARVEVLPLVDRDYGIVCDLGTTENLDQVVSASDDKLPRIVTLFGILPNFEPAPLLFRIARLLRPNDLLLISANLAPGSDYAAGVEKVLPQYDNTFTRDWLMTFLFDLGFEKSDGDLAFAIETDSRKLRRITAHFEVKQTREVLVQNERFSFPAGERVRVFFSYRHTAATMRSLLNEQALDVIGEWLNDTMEEGVFLCRKSAA
ncbi:MAG TPA: L-histidine N(alpha)-methyltransferase [Methylomirabilota bacterium]|nr:L-histidine N(alpha)-methyltransferase [Methylomirabilota bacterium]